MSIFNSRETWIKLLKFRELFVGLDQQPFDGILELVPGYRSLMVVYHPLRINIEKLKNKIDQTLGQLDTSQLPAPRTVEIPVVYGEEYGPDLEWVAEFQQITPGEVIRLHTQPIWYGYRTNRLDDAGLPLSGRSSRCAGNAASSNPANPCAARICRYCPKTNRYLSGRKSGRVADYRTHTGRLI